MEYDSRETTRRAQSPFWRRFNDAVTTGDAFAGALVDQRRAIVLGLVGVDCAHNCPAELHPVYAMAIHVNNGQPESFSTPFDDQWTFFARNFGNEGYCGGADRPLLNGFGRQGLQVQTDSLLIPEPPDGPYSSYRLRDGSQLISSNTALASTTLTKVPGGLLLSFRLGSPVDQLLLDGDLHIEWLP